MQRTGALYPVNWLRNLVIRNATTEYIFTVDADFVPSQNLMSSLLTKLKQLHRKHLDKNHAVIVPAFEQFSNVAKLPEAKRDVIILVDVIGDMDVFHRRWHPDGHRIWKYDVWKESKNSYKLDKETVCSEPEPYIAVRKAVSPYFPEILLERGRNRVAYHFEMCVRDFQFVVLADAFLVHKAHAESTKARLRVDRCVMNAWNVYRDNLGLVYNKTHLYKTSAITGLIYDICYILLTILIEFLWLLLLETPLLCYVVIRKYWSAAPLFVTR